MSDPRPSIFEHRPLAKPIALGMVLGSALLALLALLDGGETATYPTPLDGSLPAVPGDAGKRLDKVVQSMWWHQPRFVNGLRLDVGLRHTMDAACREALGRRWQLRRFERDHRSDFRQALEAGDLTRAERSVKVRRKVAAELATVEQTMILEIMGLLDQQQTETLRGSYPGLLSGAWLVDVGRRPRREPPSSPAEP